MGIGYLIGLVVAGVVASFLFARLAAEKGYPVGRARRYPLMLMGAALLMSLVLLVGVVVLGAMAESLKNVLSVVFMVGNWFVIAVYLVVLNKAYSNMKLAPEAEALRRRMQEMQKGRGSGKDEGAN